MKTSHQARVLGRKANSQVQVGKTRKVEGEVEIRQTESKRQKRQMDPTFKKTQGELTKRTTSPQNFTIQVTDTPKITQVSFQEIMKPTVQIHWLPIFRMETKHFKVVEAKKQQSIIFKSDKHAQMKDPMATVWSSNQK